MISDINPGMGASGSQADVGGGVTKAAEKTKQGAEQLRSKAVERAAGVRDRANSSRERAADRVRRVGIAVRHATDDLRQEDELVARYADRASQRLERAADYLRTTEPNEIVHDLEDFVRQRPAVFFGGAFLLGLAAGRFLKSSRQQAYESEQVFEQDLYEPETFEAVEATAPVIGRPPVATTDIVDVGPGAPEQKG